MAINIGKEMTALQRMTVAELRRRYAEVCGEPTASRHKVHLVRRILWQIQANAEGSLSDRARARAAELVREADLRLTAPKNVPGGSGPPDVAGAIRFTESSRLPPPGTILTRRYRGEVFHVQVLRDGFDYAGRVYRSLSAVAKAITGTHWNGYHFFHLEEKGKRGGTS